MRVNLTKKEIVNSIYMQIGFSKVISKRKVVLFKPSKELKIKINQAYETKT